MCDICGGTGQVPCDSGCQTGLNVKGGVCSSCGANNQPPCDNGCKAGTVLNGNLCRTCGNLNQLPCSNGCLYPLKVAGGVCKQCGNQGQVPCDNTGCNQGLVNKGNVCSQASNPQNQNNCATLGQSCVADFVNGTHCCQDSGPQLCVFGACKACIPHGQEVPANGTQVCCDAKNGDVPKFDQATEKTICDIPG